jgi:hypothetical protein
VIRLGVRAGRPGHCMDQRATAAVVNEPIIGARRRRSIDSDDGDKADELLASQPIKITAFMEDTLIEAEAACLWQSSLPRFHDLLALLVASDEAQHLPNVGDTNKCLQ